MAKDKGKMYIKGFAHQDIVSILIQNGYKVKVRCNPHPHSGEALYEINYKCCNPFEDMELPFT